MKAIGFSIVVFCIVLSSCIKDKYTDDDFTLNKTEYTGDQMKIDGYYYSPVEGEDYFLLYVFYRNGVVLIPGVDNNPDSYITGISLDPKLGETKFCWGLFLIEDNTISIEYYVPKLSLGMPANLETGDIINDSTFVITSVERSKDGAGHRILNETYHYKHFSPKPDSTNNFLK